MIAKNLYNLIAAVCIAGGINIEPVNAASGDTYHTAGPICQAANLTQAGKLRWSHKRLFNPGPLALWVVCPVHKDVATDAGTRASVNTYFLPAASATAEVTCIWRRMAWNNPASVEAFDVQKAVKPAGGGASAIPFAPSSTLSAGGEDHWTVTCLLSSGSGIASIGVFL